MDENQLPVDFRHLETFCRVAELKSFTKAAEDLCLTQPTVSGHILSLEQSLSLRLFDRNGRTVRLTKAGEVFLRYASQIISSRRDLFNALSEFSEGIRGELSLGASTIPGEYLLPKLMARFKKENPHGILSLKVADTKEIVQYVLEGAIEFGIIGAKLAIPSLHFDRYEEDEIIIVAPPGHPLANKKKIGFERLMQEPWIIREAGSGTQMAVEKTLERAGKNLKQLNIVMKMGSTSSLKEGVKSGLGLAFISQKAVGDELEYGLLSRIRAEEIEPISRQFYIVYPRGKTFSPIGTRFFRFLKENR